MRNPLRNLFGAREKRSTFVSQDDLSAFLGGSRSSAHARLVSPDNSMQISAVLACVRLLTRSFASLSGQVYRRTGGRGKERATDHPAYTLFHSRPNPFMSSFTWRELMLRECLLKGNAYSEVEFDGAGQPVALWPLQTSAVRVVRKGRSAHYEVNGTGGPVILSAEQVLHFHELGDDGYKGAGIVALGRESIGLSAAAQEYSAAFFENDSSPGGVLEYAGRFKDEASAERLRKSFESMHKGGRNAHRIAVLEDGVQFKPIGVDGQKSQLIETRRFQVADIARLFGVPPHMIGDLDQATFSNIEQQSLEFVVYSLGPWLVLFEQEINYKMFFGAESDLYFAEYLVDSLLRGDTVSRQTALQIMRQNGVINADDWAEIENRNPLPDGRGQGYIVPLNFGTAGPNGSVINPNAPGANSLRSANLIEWRKAAAPGVKSRTAVEDSFLPVFRDALARVVRRETRGLRDALKAAGARSEGSDFLAALDKFYSDPNWIGDYTRSAHDGLFEGVKSAAALEVAYPVTTGPEIDAFIREYTAAFVIRHATRSRQQIEAIVREAIASHADFAAAVEQRLAEWEEKRPDKVAIEETRRGGNAIARTVFVASGMLTLRWFTQGRENCPMCQAMDGKSVGRTAPFVAAGETVGDQVESITVSTNIHNPPLHAGCDCHISPGGV